MGSREECRGRGCHRLRIVHRAPMPRDSASCRAAVRIRSAILSEEREEPQPEHVERGHAGGDDADQPEHVLAACPGRPENRILREEGREGRQARDGESRRQSCTRTSRACTFAGRPCGACPARRRGRESPSRQHRNRQRLEEGVGHQVEDACAHTPATPQPMNM